MIDRAIMTDEEFDYYKKMFFSNEERINIK